MKRAIAFVVIAFVAACSALGPADQAQIDADAALILKCQNLGRACKADGGTNCYSVYDQCMKEGGLH